MRFLILPIALLSLPAWGAIDDVLRSPHVFSEAPLPADQTVRVPTVRVVMADYDLIAHDFEAQARRANESVAAWKTRVDAWLVAETGFILKAQTRQDVVNSPIKTVPEVKAAYRPSGYRRAHVLPVPGGLVDAKGTGTAYPQQRHHGNGLATLGEMIREFIFEKLVNEVMTDARANVRTVGSYAAMDFGFDVIHQDGSRDRAGYILRQAHVRASGNISTLGKDEAYQVEKILRRYGLTSSGETYGVRHATQPQHEWDYTNIQGTNNTRVIEIIDFGAYLAVDQFRHRLVSHTDVYKPLLEPGQPDFIQPDPARRVPLEQWGNLGVADPKMDKVWIWSHELARAWAEGRADRGAADQHLQALLEPFKHQRRSAGMCRTVMISTK